MRFCPSCGKQGIEGDFCNDCTPQVIGFKDIYLKVCYQCNNYSFEGKWQRGTVEEGLKEIALKNIKAVRKPKISIEINLSKKGPGLKVKGIVLVNNEYEIPAEVQYTYCQKCSLGKSEYFEGILQIRKPTNELIAFIKKEFALAAKKGVHMTNAKDVTNGVDFYSTSNEYIQQLGNKLVKTFGGTLKINPRLFSKQKQTSKTIYRVAVFYEPPIYGLGNVVLIDDKIIKLTVVGKLMGGLDLKTGKNVKMESKHKTVEVLPVYKADVSQTYPSVEVISPVTFQQIKLITHEPVKKEKVDVVIVDDVAYQV